MSKENIEKIHPQIEYLSIGTNTDSLRFVLYR